MTVRVEAIGTTTSLADRKRRAGQRLLIGFEGTAVGDDLRKLVREIQPAGFVLFARNVAEPGQVRELNRELLSLSDPYLPALRCVVHRVKVPAHGIGHDPHASVREVKLPGDRQPRPGHCRGQRLRDDLPRSHASMGRRNRSRAAVSGESARPHGA